MKFLSTMTSCDAADNLDRYIEERRLIQGLWNRDTNDGRHLVCLMSAIHQDIGNEHECPANIMPEWVSQAIPMLFDSLAPDDIYEVAGRFSMALRKGSFTDASQNLLSAQIARILLRQASQIKVITESEVWVGFVGAITTIITLHEEVSNPQICFDFMSSLIQIAAEPTQTHDVLGDEESLEVEKDLTRPATAEDFLNIVGESIRFLLENDDETIGNLIPNIQFLLLYEPILANKPTDELSPHYHEVFREIFDDLSRCAFVDEDEEMLK